MNIKIKYIKGGETSLEIPESTSISTLKSLISPHFSIPPEHQKLIYKGRILEDSKNIQDYSIKSSDTIILTSSYSAKPEPSPSQPVLPQPSEENKTRPVHPDHSEEAENKAEVRKGTFNFLIGNPQFEEIIRIIRNDPRAFEDFIIQLKTVNPELFDLINDNKKEFIELIRGRDAESDQMQLSKQEFKEVKELMELGFSAQESLEAYLSCGKHKETAANFLFSNPRNN